MSMERDKSANKANGEIGASYHIFSNLVNELRCESIIMLHVLESDFSILQNRAIKQSIKEGIIEDDFDKKYIVPIFTDLEEISSKMYSTFVNYYILRLTGVLELYFKDSIKELLKLNIDLLVKGFEGIKKEKLMKDLKKNYDSKVYLQCLNNIATKYSNGKKFSGKYKKYSKLLDINIDDVGVIGKLDNLFSLRNDLAHLNRFSDDQINSRTRPSIITERGFKYSRETQLSRENFEEVVKKLLKLTYETSEFLKEVEQATNSKWSRFDESAEDHYNRLVQIINQ